MLRNLGKDEKIANSQYGRQQYKHYTECRYPITSFSFQFSPAGWILERWFHGLRCNLLVLLKEDFGIYIHISTQFFLMSPQGACADFGDITIYRLKILYLMK